MTIRDATAADAAHVYRTRLVQAMLSRAEQNGDIEVTVPTRRAAGFYRRLGFEETATYLKRRRGVMTMKIIVDDLSGPEIAAFIDDHVRDMRAITPLESKHALDLDGLRKPEVTFWSVYDGDALVGCGAIKRLSADHAEVKAMRTDPSRKRNGIASLLLEHIIAEAERTGYTRLSLETGTAEPFTAARKLYEKFGFEYTEPFADYTRDPHSAYMTRTLPTGRRPDHRP